MAEVVDRGRGEDLFDREAAHQARGPDGQVVRLVGHLLSSQIDRARLPALLDVAGGARSLLLLLVLL